jgi:hypothetical protein
METWKYGNAEMQEHGKWICGTTKFGPGDSSNQGFTIVDGIQEYGNIEIQKYRNTEILKYAEFMCDPLLSSVKGMLKAHNGLSSVWWDTDIRKYTNTQVHKYSNTEIRKYRNTE